MRPARPTPRSSRRAVAAARSDPPRTVAEAYVPCPRFQARGFKPEAQPTRLALRSGHTPPVPGPHSEVTAPPYTPQPRDRASCRRPTTYPSHSAFRPHAAGPGTALRRYSASVTVSRPYTAGTGLRSRNHARAATIAHRIATGPNPLRQQHAGIATSLRILRNPPQATQRNHPTPHRSVSPLRTATRHACFRASSDNQRHPDFLLYSGNAPSPRLSDRNSHSGFRTSPSGSPQVVGTRSAPDIARPKPPKIPDRGSSSRDTRPPLPETSGHSFPRHPAAPRIRPPDSPPKTTSRPTESGAAPQLTKKTGGATCRQTVAPLKTDRRHP